MSKRIEGNYSEVVYGHFTELRHQCSYAVGRSMRRQYSSKGPRHFTFADKYKQAITSVFTRSVLRAVTSMFRRSVLRARVSLSVITELGFFWLVFFQRKTPFPLRQHFYVAKTTRLEELRVLSISPFKDKEIVSTEEV